MNEKPSYYAIIPAEVRYDNELRANEKLFFGEIVALSNTTGICNATNNYFANLYGVVPSAISKWVKDLEEKKYIQVEYVKKGGEIIERKIIILGIHKYDKVFTKVVEGYSQKNRGYSQKLKGNNIYINNTSNNNIKENVKRKVYFEKEELNNIFLEFLDLRKKIKAVNSDRAINSLLKTLEPYSDEIKYKMIEKSIVNSWKGLFEYKPTKEELKKQRELEIEKWLEEESNEQK